MIEIRRKGEHLVRRGDGGAAVSCSRFAVRSRISRASKRGSSQSAGPAATVPKYEDGSLLAQAAAQQMDHRRRRAAFAWTPKTTCSS